MKNETAFFLFQWLSKHLGLNQFLPNNKLMKFLAYDCELLRIDKKICENVIFSICGFDKEEFNEVSFHVHYLHTLISLFYLNLSRLVIFFVHVTTRGKLKNEWKNEINSIFILHLF